MDAPETNYARRDGLHIGYQVLGNGDTDILDVGCGTYISIDEAGDQPQWHRYNERLAECGRVIRFDPSGIGLSDTPADLAALTLESWVEDALAVLDACQSTRAVVLAASSSSLLGLLLAAEHPERTESLVVINGSARYLEADDYPIGIPVDLMEEFRSGLDPDGDGPSHQDLSDLRLFAPTAEGDPEFRRWWSRASKRGAAPATATVLGDLTVSSDVRGLLPGIGMPTLVLHRREALAPSVEHGRYIADHISEARLVTLPGDDVVPFVGDLDGLVDEIQEFITGDRYGPTPDRVLATILFTDIVDSTDAASRMGDRQWTQVLRDLDGLVRRQLEQFGGQLVKDTGDGSLAIFDGPTRAIRCALTIRDGAGHLGITLRAGLHAGEIERRGQDVSGIAVHVAARVVAEADAGEIMASNTIVDLVEGAGISFLDRGARTLKGVRGPRRLWAVVTA
jgi:class 3 adenylate cyclase/pimeloyl-ACP methyl ester carboxylesterase